MRKKKSCVNMHKHVAANAFTDMHTYKRMNNVYGCVCVCVCVFE